MKTLISILAIMVALGCQKEEPDTVPIPDKVEIFGITVTNLPQNKVDGTPWDEIGSPDLYIRISNINSNSTGPTYGEFDTSSPLVEIISFESEYGLPIVISIFDEDIANDDFVDSYTGILNPPLDETSITLISDTGVEYELSYSITYK